MPVRRDHGEVMSLRVKVTEKSNTAGRLTPSLPPSFPGRCGPCVAQEAGGMRDSSDEGRGGPSEVPPRHHSSAAHVERAVRICVVSIHLLSARRCGIQFRRVTRHL